MKLTDTRERILLVLKLDRTPPTAREISQMCGEHNRASDWAHGPLREMAWHGLVAKVGVAFDNAGTWTITDAGRAALAEKAKSRLCEECGAYPADPPSKICPGCQAYEDHAS